MTLSIQTLHFDESSLLRPRRIHNHDHHVSDHIHLIASHVPVHPSLSALAPYDAHDVSIDDTPTTSPSTTPPHSPIRTLHRKQSSCHLRDDFKRDATHFVMSIGVGMPLGNGAGMIHREQGNIGGRRQSNGSPKSRHTSLSKSSHGLACEA